MHIEQLLASEAKVKVLRCLFDLPRALDVDGLVEETGKSRSGVYKALGELEATGLLASHRRGRRTVYQVAAGHPLYEPLYALFKSEGSRQGVEHLLPAFWNHLEPVVSALSAAKPVRFVLLYGSAVDPPMFPGSDVDLLVGVDGETALPEVPDAVEGHAVSVHAIAVGDFLDKVRRGDPFIGNVLERQVPLYVSPKLRDATHWPEDPPFRAGGMVLG